MSKNDFFIGWSADTPRADRRFFLGAGLGLITATAATAGVLAYRQNRPGPGTWNQGEVREWRGTVSADPYAMLRTADLDGTPRTALLSCLGKCGVSARIGALSGKSVIVKGSLITRAKHAMIAVVDGLDWIREDTETGTRTLAFPPVEALGEVTLRGEILDTKCWFGAMRPSEGKVHKACASLCIRSGIPPGFYVTDRQSQNRLMIMTDRGLGHSEALLPFVGDPVEITATAQKWGNLLLLDGPVSDIRRL